MDPFYQRLGVNIEWNHVLGLLGKLWWAARRRLTWSVLIFICALHYLVHDSPSKLMLHWRKVTLAEHHFRKSSKLRCRQIHSSSYQNLGIRNQSFGFLLLLLLKIILPSVFAKYFETCLTLTHNCGRVLRWELHLEKRKLGQLFNSQSGESYHLIS